jgi:hypothetical protein
MDRQFIRRFQGFHLVYQLVRRLQPRLLSRYRQFIRRCPFFFFSFLFFDPWHRPFFFFSFLFFDPWKIEYLLNLACGVLASLGPRNVYKDMLNNMVSPIDHVVMNHQNQTRTNGKWGHVRYSYAGTNQDLSLVIIPLTTFSLALWYSFNQPWKLAIAQTLTWNS